MDIFNTVHIVDVEEIKYTKYRIIHTSMSFIRDTYFYKSCFWM